MEKLLMMKSTNVQDIISWIYGNWNRIEEVFTTASGLIIVKEILNGKSAVD
jgi:hypothetical protein